MLNAAKRFKQHTHAQFYDSLAIIIQDRQKDTQTYMYVRVMEHIPIFLITITLADKIINLVKHLHLNLQENIQEYPEVHQKQ